jgi:hypothetical protein
MPRTQYVQERSFYEEQDGYILEIFDFHVPGSDSVLFSQPRITNRRTGETRMGEKTTWEDAHRWLIDQMLGHDHREHHPDTSQKDSRTRPS